MSVMREYLLSVARPGILAQDGISVRVDDLHGTFNEGKRSQPSWKKTTSW